jgi:uncharacterized protein YndB with AHSA1/START domain
MKWLIAILVILVGTVLIVVIIGALLPRDHASSRAARYKESPAEVWSAITDYSKFPEWRKSVKQVEGLPAVNGQPSWRETDSHGNVIPYEITESTAPQRMVTRIANPKLPFGGTWTYQISSAPDGATVLRITENGEIYNPVFRFVSRFFMGYSATQEQYLRDLGNKFGEQVNVEN